MSSERLVEDAVAVVALVARSLRGVGLRREDTVGHRVVEVELGRQHGLAIEVDLRVDVHRAALVVAGVDRREAGDAIGVGHLRAAQEPLALAGVEARVDAARVAVPDVDHRVGDRLAAVGVAHAQRESERRAVAILADVGADPVRVEVVRALGLLDRLPAARARVELRDEPVAGGRLRLDRGGPALLRGDGGGRGRRRPPVGAAAGAEQGPEADGAEGGQRLAATETSRHGAQHRRRRCEAAKASEWPCAILGHRAVSGQNDERPPRRGRPLRAAPVAARA